MKLFDEVAYYIVNNWFQNNDNLASKIVYTVKKAKKNVFEKK